MLVVKVHSFLGELTGSSLRDVKTVCRRFTSESREDVVVYVFRVEESQGENVQPFLIHNRLFISVEQNGITVIIEDNFLNIKGLIDLWDCKPKDFSELAFGSTLERYMLQSD